MSARAQYVPRLWYPSQLYSVQNEHTRWYATHTHYHSRVLYYWVEAKVPGITKTILSPATM